VLERRTPYRDEVGVVVKKYLQVKRSTGAVGAVNTILIKVTVPFLETHPCYIRQQHIPPAVAYQGKDA
jgi:hypothetical protein